MGSSIIAGQNELRMTKTWPCNNTEIFAVNIENHIKKFLLLK